jgi:hypothetical protein
MKRVYQVIIATIIMALLLFGGAAPYGQDEPTGAPIPTPTPTPTSVR